MPRVLVSAAIVALVAAPGGAQGTSPTDDLIARVAADVNDLRYADAIRRGREVFSFATNMRPAQIIALRGAMAAAFYPEEASAQRSDSALAHLTEIVKIAPDATLPVALRWPGLDSLFAAAKSRTLAVVMRPTGVDTLVGAEGEGDVPVVASRPVRFRLRVNAMPSGASVLHDTTTTPATTATLMFKGHDGRAALLSTGEYEFVVTAFDPVTRDSTTVRHLATAVGAAPVPVPVPSFDTAQLLAEYSKPPRVRMVLTSIVFAGATVAIASTARAEEPIASAFKNDGRAVFLSVAMIGAAVGGFWLDKGGVNVNALRANMALRNAHLKALQEADAESKRRIAAYRVTVQIRPEAR